MNKTKYVYTFQKSDVGKTAIRLADGTLVFIDNVIGRVLTRDIGKRMFRIMDDANHNYVYQVENDAQLAKRVRQLENPTK